MDKPKTKKEKTKDVLRRAMWGFMALLFVITGVGVGIYYFWQATHQPKQDTSTVQPQTNQLQGTKLAGFTPVASVDSLQKVDQKVGTGTEVKADSSVTVNYTGALAATGVIFESSLDSGQPASFPLNGVIKGWQDGMLGMKVGGERRLLIPADDAYGTSGNSKIPPSSDLVFDIQLLGVK